MEKYFSKQFNYNDIKAVIIDFDETLYFSNNIRDYYINFIQKSIMILGNYTKEKANEIMLEYGFTKENKKSPSFGKTCSKFGISKNSWDNYRVDNFFAFDYEKAQTVSAQTLENMSRYFPLYLVSNEVDKNIKIKAKKLNIDLSVFTKILAPSVTTLLTHPSKKEVYANIAKELNILPSNMLVIGDRLKVDVEPLLELGGSGIIVKHPDEFKIILNEMNKFLLV